MSLFSESEFIFIGRGDESFLENYSYELTDDASGRGGKIFMALEILNNQAEAEDIGEAIFANFRQEFYKSLELEAYDRFEQALKAVNATIASLKEQKVSRFIGNLNVAMGAVRDGMLFISTAGDAEVYLIRRRFVSIVSEGLSEDSKNDTFSNIANGTLEKNDCVLFSSSRLLRYITKGELGKLFSLEAPQQIGRALTDLQDYLMTEILGRSAVVGICMGEREEVPLPMEESVFDNPQQPSRFAAIADRIKKLLPAIKFPQLSFLKNIRLPDLSFLRSIGSKFSRLMPRGLMGRITSALPPRAPESRMPKIRFPAGMSKERILLTVIGLLIVLIGGVFWLRSRSNEKRIIAELQSKLNAVREIVSEAATVGQFDKPRASEMLVSAEQQALEVLGSCCLRTEAVRTLEEIQKARDSLDTVQRVIAPTVLVDFSEKRSNVSALGLLALKDGLFGFEYNALYEIVLDRLSDPQTISSIETVILGTPYPEGDSLLFLTRTGKLIEYAGGRFADVTTKDGVWKKGVDMKAYNERLYILDPDRNQVWRYQRRREGFDLGEQYNQNADLKNAVSLAIDASIYVLNSDGTILQLYQGQKQDYALKKSPLTPMAAPTKIFTAPELNHLFILEPSRGRVLLYHKDPQNGGAQYQTQYVFDKTGTLRDLAVVDGRLYVMDEKKVYVVNLSGL